MGAELRREMHINSLNVYYEGKEEWFSKRETAVLGKLRELKRATDRDVMAALGFVDPNAVRPRISELIDEGLIVEVGSSEDVITGKTVRIVALAPDPRKAQRLFDFAINPA